MAYAAVFSLKHTITGLVNSSHISLASTSLEIIQHVYHVMKSLNEILDRVDTTIINGYKRLNVLDGQIRETVCKLEDVIESHVTNQIISQSECPGYVLQFCIDMQDLKQEICLFVETLKEIEEEYLGELECPLLEEAEGEAEEEEDLAAEEDVISSSIIDFGGKKLKIVGFSDEYNELKEKHINDGRNTLEVVSLVGMAGIGKTTLAKKVFEYILIVSHFDCRAWVTVGRKCQVNKILRDVVAQVNFIEGDEEIAEYSKASLEGGRYLIVLDDLWDSKVWKDIELSLPKNNNGSRVLVTTRLQEVANDTTGYLNVPLKMCLLSGEESWDLHCEKVFDEEPCPRQLEKAGKKIAEHCEGLPLTIVTVANLLSKAEKSLEFWSEVAAQKKTSTFH